MTVPIINASIVQLPFSTFLYDTGVGLYQPLCQLAKCQALSTENTRVALQVIAGRRYFLSRFKVSIFIIEPGTPGAYADKLPPCSQVVFSPLAALLKAPVCPHPDSWLLLQTVVSSSLLTCFFTTRRLCALWQPCSLSV